MHATCDELPKPVAGSRLGIPWVQLALGIVCMASVASLQYGWTLFVNPIDTKYHWGRSAIQVAFTVFVVVETVLVPVEGYVVDRFGPRWVVLTGGILVALSWMINSGASSLAILYVAAVLGGAGAGCVYGTCVGNALKWFPGRRGLAAGATAAGFGAGAALTIAPISHVITSAGYEQAFWIFGLVQGGIVFALAWFLLPPPPHLLASAAKPSQSAHGYGPGEVLRSPVFYVLYLMFVLIAAGGLTMTASMAPIARDLKVDSVPLNLLGFTTPVVVFAVSLNRIFDGAGRPFFGWLSDRMGREHTMALAFCLGAAALFTLNRFGTTPAIFVLLTALYFGTYGEIFSLFPATQGDIFGSKFAAANAGLLYTAKGVGGLLVPSAAAIALQFGWSVVFTVAMCLNLSAALLALFVLKPMRIRHVARSRETLNLSK
jgi:MFS transporter, OFA family, oxalate/formate antiporter